MTPFFSIIIPVYNVAPYLRECLDSVLTQTFTDWEAICVDDGSNDGSGAILDEYALSDSRIRVVHQSNAGVVAARMAGFVASNGKRILFLDGDDTLAVNALECICGVDDEIELVQFGFRYVREGKVTKVCRPAVVGQFARQVLLEKISRSPLELLGMCIGNKCYRREVVEKAFAAVGHVRIPHSEDGLFALAAFWVSANVAFRNDIIYNYRFRSESASHVFNPDIVAVKEAFVSAATELARSVGGQSEGRCRAEFDYHSREAIGHIFVMSTEDRVSYKDGYYLLKQMAKSRFFKDERSQWNRIRRWTMRLFVRFPLVCMASRGLLQHLIRKSLTFRRRIEG